MHLSTLLAAIALYLWSCRVQNEGLFLENVKANGRVEEGPRITTYLGLCGYCALSWRNTEWTPYFPTLCRPCMSPRHTLQLHLSCSPRTWSCCTSVRDQNPLSWNHTGDVVPFLSMVGVIQDTGHKTSIRHNTEDTRQTYDTIHGTLQDIQQISSSMHCVS